MNLKKEVKVEACSDPHCDVTWSVSSRMKSEYLNSYQEVECTLMLALFLSEPIEVCPIYAMI